VIETLKSNIGNMKRFLTNIPYIIYYLLPTKSSIFISHKKNGSVMLSTLPENLELAFQFSNYQLENEK
jgi:hypothetical protein